MKKRLGRIGLAISLGFGLIVPVSTSAHAAYAFTSHTFTNCSQTGRTGPTQAACRSAYTTAWDEADANFTVSAGIQIWTVPVTGTYRIDAYGAAGSGGNGTATVGGKGARVQGDFNLTEGDKIRILVGQMGTNNVTNISDGASGSGGGGTFVIAGITGTSDTQTLLIAAGGNGSNDQVYQGSAITGANGNYTTSGTGDANVNGGSYRGTSTGTSNDGASFANGGQGVTYSRGGSTGNGGFGGGGAGDDGQTGGGGWVGGSLNATTGAYSKNNGLNPTGVSGANTGQGYVTITALGPSVTSFAPASPLVNSASLSFNLVLSQSSTGIDVSDFSAAGSGSSTCVIDSVSGIGTTYSISISLCSEGIVYLVLASNVATNSNSQTGPISNVNSSSATIDLTAPTVSSITAPANANYTPTQLLNFTIVFNESVTISNTPRIALTLTAATRYANFVSMTDSKTATFRFTVAADQSEADINGISVVSPLDPNGGSIQDLAGNSMTNFGFTVPNTTSVNIYQAPSAPTIESITANNTSLSINFTAGSANGSVISNYKYSLNGGAFTAFSPVDSITPLILNGLTNGTTYSIQIKAVSNLGDGLASNILSQAPTASARLSIFLTASATTAVKGTLITITANISQAGVVTFFWNDKRISGCIKKSATTAATCQWKPNVTGQWSVQALLDPTDPTYVDSYSPKLPVFILSRSGNR